MGRQKQLKNLESQLFDYCRQNLPRECVQKFLELNQDVVTLRFLEACEESEDSLEYDDIFKFEEPENYGENMGLVSEED